MDNLVVIATFTYPHELAIIKGKLESEGIQAFTRDENTVQVYNLYSNAIGGVKLLVHSSDVEEALEVLREAGYKPLADEPAFLFEKEITALLNWVDRTTSKIPLLGSLPFALRLIFVAVPALLLIAGLIVLVVFRLIDA